MRLHAAAAFAWLGATAQAADPCSMCAIWKLPHQPFKIYGDTYYVGTNALSVMLIASPEGHVLIDGAIVEAVPQIVANIAALGFHIEDVKLILNSHAHFDHAGGLAQLQRLSGAAVKAGARGAEVLAGGGTDSGDPQARTLLPIEPIANVGAVTDNEVLRVGPTSITAVATPGHTRGGMSWTWPSCENRRCVNVVYADSLTAVSSPGFRFSDSREYPGAVADFGRSFAALAALPCDILVSTHPEFSNLWKRLERRERGEQDALIDATACRRYVDGARSALEKRLAAEQTDTKAE